MPSKLKYIILVLSFCLMVLIDLRVSGELLAQDGEPSGEFIISWDIESGTGHLVALFPHIAYRYHVETIRKHEDCELPQEEEYIKWTVGRGTEAVCYFTMKEPGWVMWKKSGKWLWIGSRTKGSL